MFDQLHHMTVIHDDEITFVIQADGQQAIAARINWNQEFMVQRNRLIGIAFNLVTDDIEHQTMPINIQQDLTVFLRQVDLNAEFHQIMLIHLFIAE